MKRFLWLLTAFLTTIQNAFAFDVDHFMDTTIAPVSDAIAKVIFTPISFFGNDVPIIIFWILFAGIFFTIYFKFYPFIGDKIINIIYTINILDI